MIRGFVAGTVLLILAGCASSPPEPTAQVAATTAPASSNPITAVSKNEAQQVDLHVVDVPEVPEAAAVAAVGAPAEDELVCKRIRTTGSHRLTRVCWTRADLEARRAADQRMMDTMRRTPQSNTVGGEPSVGP